ncbi:hypothetical protein YC2023_039791 [Brassica napus]
MDLISDQDQGLRTQKDAMKQDAIVNAIEAMAVIRAGSGAGLGGDRGKLCHHRRFAVCHVETTVDDGERQLFIIEKAGLFGTRAGEVLQVIDVTKGTLNNVITFPPVIDPSQNVTSEFRDRAPAAMAMMDDVIEKLLVFFRRPKPFFQLLFENVYMDGDIRVAKDIRGDYLVVDRAPFNWKE